MKKKPIFSIIICLFKLNDRFYGDLKRYKALLNKNFEIVLVCEKNAKLDEKKLDKLADLNIQIVHSPKNRISLEEKRDLGVEAAKGGFCAFIDDDAYPDKEWLSNAYEDFQSSDKVGVVGGPNVTPLEDSYWQKIGGYIYESYLTSAGAQYRFLPRKKRFVLELQGVNMIISKNVLKELGSFNSQLNSGDDSKVCSGIRQAGYKILYDPKVFVFHHRRKFPIEHLKQIKNMGTHRGYFVKAFPETLAPIYFLPVILVVLTSMVLLFSIFSKEARVISIFLFLLFFLTAYISVIRRAGFINSVFISLGILLTHITYGVFFLKGFLKKDLY